MRRGILLAVYTGNPDVFIRTFPQMTDQHNNRTESPLHRPGSKLETGKLYRKVMVKPQTSPKSRPRASRSINDNYCVVKKSETVILHVNSFAANVPFVTGLPQKKGVNPNYWCTHTEIKHVNNVSCVGHLSSVTSVTNVPTVVTHPPVGARLQQFWEKWVRVQR